MLWHDGLVYMLQTFYFLSLFSGTRTWQSETETSVDLLIWLHFELSNIRRFQSDNLKQKQVWTCSYVFILNFQSGDFRVLQHSLQNKYINSQTHKMHQKLHTLVGTHHHHTNLVTHNTVTQTLASTHNCHQNLCIYMCIYSADCKFPGNSTISVTRMNAFLMHQILLLYVLKSKVFKYAKWPSKWLTNESLVSDLMK